MNILNHPVISRCKRRFIQFRTASAVIIHQFVSRSRIVLPAIVRFLWRGTQTRITLTKKMGEPWVSRNFPDLQPRRLMHSVCQMLPLIWTDMTTASERTFERIPPARLKRIKRDLQRLPQTNRMPRSAAARRLMQAAFARSAAVVTSQPIPQELVSSLRADRCLRDLMLTWIDLILVTTAHPNPGNMQSSLAVHATLTLPAGDHLPMNLRRQLGSVRRELNSKLTNSENVRQTESLKRRMELSSSQVLTLPMAFADALQQSS